MRRSAVVLSLLALASLWAAGGAAASAPPPGLTGNLLVLLEPRDAGIAAVQGAVRAQVASLGARPAGRSVPQIGLITLRPPAGIGLDTFAARLRQLPGVASVQPERRYVPRLVPNDPALTASDPNSGVVQWVLAKEGFYSAWSISTGKGALVGVVDTGIDASHPDLSPKLAVPPVDQQASENSTGPATTDQVGHGTHVASLACAATNNGIGMAGAGYDCKLVIEKTDFTDSSIAASIVDATDRHVQAINMSFGPQNPSSAPAPASEVRALDYAASHKVVLVAAAADSPETEQGDPANVLQPAGTGPNLGAGIGIDVTAAQWGGTRASFAGYGSEISMAAYGAFEPDAAGLFGVGPPPGIFGAFPSNSTQLEAPPDLCGCRTTFQGSSDWAYLQGTSMAAPQVAAVGAMMRELNPFATLGDVLRALKQTAQRPAGSGWSPDLGWGILDAGAALDAIRRVDRLAPVAKLKAPRVSRTRLFRLRWSGHDARYPGLIASGIAYYEVYVKHGRRWRLWKRTTRHSATFRGRLGRRYGFEVVAVDHAGNRQRHPSRATTSVAR